MNIRDTCILGLILNQICVYDVFAGNIYQDFNDSDRSNLLFNIQNVVQQ